MDRSPGTWVWLSFVRIFGEREYRNHQRPRRGCFHLQGRIYWRGGFSQGKVNIMNADRSYLATGLHTGALHVVEKRDGVVGMLGFDMMLFYLHGEPDGSRYNHGHNCRCYPPGVAIESSDYLTRLRKRYGILSIR